MRYSLVIPAHNEEEAIKPLYEAVKGVMEVMEAESPSPEGVEHTQEEPPSPKLRRPQWEMVLIDDGSTDGTLQIMKELRAQDPRVKIVGFRRNFGQTAGWSAGFDHASGDIVIVMDADLQNDPKDIPAMVEKLYAEDLDVVSGWRKDRKDKGSLRLGSKIGNWLRQKVTGEKIHDQGCSLKVYRKEALEELELYGEMHRYITALLTWKGFRVGEIVVRHHPRTTGETKYNIRKKLKGFLDLLIVKFWIQYSARPMHFFGAIGAAFIGAGLLLGGTLAVIWGLRITGFANSSLPILAVLFVLLGFQFLLSGVLADVVAHTYYAQKKPYTIREAEGFDLTN